MRNGFPLYVAHIHQNLWQDLLELQGSTLVCDCEDHTLCEADLLAGLVFDATSPALTSTASPSVPHQRSTCSPTPLRKVLLTAALGVGGLPFEPPFILQESLALAFKRFYPEPWFQGFAFPSIEDLVNSFPLDLYSRWRFELGYSMEGSSAPHLASSRTRQRQRNAEGQQVGAISHRAALPPLIPFGLFERVSYYPTAAVAATMATSDKAIEEVPDQGHSPSDRTARCWLHSPLGYLDQLEWHYATSWPYSRFASSWLLPSMWCLPRSASPPRSALRDLWRMADAQCPHPSPAEARSGRYLLVGAVY